MNESGIYREEGNTVIENTEFNYTNPDSKQNHDESSED